MNPIIQTVLDAHFPGVAKPMMEDCDITEKGIKPMEDQNRLLEIMTAQELFDLPKTQSISLAVASINGHYVKGQYCTLVALAVGRQFPFCRYKCVESGQLDSKWQFETELHYSL